MFSSKDRPELVEATEDHAPQPASAVRERRSFADAECMKPSTFATRRAASPATSRPPRLVSLGKTEFPQRNQRNGQLEYLDAELFTNLDKPMERYVRIDGVPGLTELHSTTGREDGVTPLPGRMKLRGRGPLPTGRQSHPDSTMPV